MQLVIFAYHFCMLPSLISQHLQLLMLTCEIYRLPLYFFFHIMQKKYLALIGYQISIFESIAMSFFDSITSFNLLLTTNLIYNMPHKKQFLSIQLAELNFIIYYFQLIIRLCIYSYPSSKMTIYISNFAR